MRIKRFCFVFSCVAVTLIPFTFTISCTNGKKTNIVENIVEKLNNYNKGDLKISAIGKDSKKTSSLEINDFKSLKKFLPQDLLDIIGENEPVFKVDRLASKNGVLVGVFEFNIENQKFETKKFEISGFMVPILATGNNLVEEIRKILNTDLTLLVDASDFEKIVTWDESSNVIESLSQFKNHSEKIKQLVALLSKPDIKKNYQISFVISSEKNQLAKIIKFKIIKLKSKEKIFILEKILFKLVEDNVDRKTNQKGLTTISHQSDDARLDRSSRAISDGDNLDGLDFDTATNGIGLKTSFDKIPFSEIKKINSDLVAKSQSLNPIEVNFSNITNVIDISVGDKNSSLLNEKLADGFKIEIIKLCSDIMRTDNRLPIIVKLSKDGYKSHYQSIMITNLANVPNNDLSKSELEYLENQKEKIKDRIDATGCNYMPSLISSFELSKIIELQHKNKPFSVLIDYLDTSYSIAIENVEPQYKVGATSLFFNLTFFKDNIRVGTKRVELFNLKPNHYDESLYQELLTIKDEFQHEKEIVAVSTINKTNKLFELLNKGLPDIYRLHITSVNTRVCKFKTRFIISVTIRKNNNIIGAKDIILLNTRDNGIPESVIIPDHEKRKVRELTKSIPSSLSASQVNKSNLSEVISLNYNPDKESILNENLSESFSLAVYKIVKKDATSICVTVIIWNREYLPHYVDVLVTDLKPDQN